jgi:plasmid stabilization system protein ParE
LDNALAGGSRLNSPVLGRFRLALDLHQLFLPDTATGACVLTAKAMMEDAMPQGDKGKYSGKQKRKAEHIAEGYEDRGVPKREAKSRAWATVNKESGGGNKSGSGRGRKDSKVSARKGGRRGGSSQSHEKRSAAAKKGWETRRRRGNG